MPDTSRKLDLMTSQFPTKGSNVFQSAIVPKSFWLGGLKINVQLDDTFVEQHNCIGQAGYHRQEIRLDPAAAPMQTTEQAYLHELVHWIFYMMNEHELRNNERLVDLFAHFLYQALITAERHPTVADASSPSQTEAHLYLKEPYYEVDFEPDKDEECLAQLEWDEEEERRYYERTEIEPWTDISDSWERSNDEGWYYDDDD